MRGLAHRIIVLMPIMATVLVATSTALAQSTTNFPLVTTARPQWSPAAAFRPRPNSTAIDTYLVPYVNNRANSGSCVEANFCTADLRARLLRNTGSLIVDIDIASMNDAQKDPDVAYNPNTDEYLVVWYDNRYGVAPTNYFRAAIYGRRVRAGDGFAYPEFQINALPTYNMVRPRISYNPTVGKYLLVWQGAPSNTMSDLAKAPWRVYGRVLHSDGTPEGDYFLVANWNVQQENPIVVANTHNGDFAVAWEDRRENGPNCGKPGYLPCGQDKSDRDIYAQIIRGGQRLLPYDLTIAAYSAGQDTNPAGAYNPDDDQYLLAWHASNHIEGFRIMASSGTIISPGTPIRIDVPASDHDYGFPHITYCAPTDRYLFAWQHVDTNSNPAQNVMKELKARKYDRNGNPTTSVFNLSNGRGKAVRSSECGSSGLTLAVWEDWRQIQMPWNMQDYRMDIYGVFVTTP